MPIYEYSCPECHKVFEEWVNHHNTDLTVPCPACGAQAGHIVSNTSFMLKGGGWYVTEYGSKKEHSSESSASTQTASSESSTSSAASAESTGASDTSSAAPTSQAEKPAAPVKQEAPAAPSSAA